MRQVILQLAVSLDGYIEGPGGEYDWCFTDQDYGMTAFLQRVDSVFYGRKSYELAVATGAAGVGAGAGWSHLREYVFSNSLQHVPPGATLISGDIGAAVRRIKQEPGKDIWLWGGASLTASLLALGLVDELRLAVHPLLLGGGKPLFPPLATRRTLTLLDAQTYSSGLVSLAYALPS
ncbi:deaminase [Hymenobacter sedentarius]|uniref:Deaminase n=1 Tax=Hymenobacter sedentarius TaxID=1411621 RepID=A0A0U4CRK3_9BACT|nr:dihydrofolate reductase family protein [Hymenobacter sedentarius]ALW86030.1 deaminase [Hymenobacter sedentarius]